MAWFKKEEFNKWDFAIGQRIKEAREQAKLTQDQLAKLVYKSQGNISDYERGKLQINALDLFLVAHALDKPAEYFVPHPLYAPTRGKDLTEKEQELIHFVRKIGDIDREEKVIALLIEQAKRLADVIIDTDVDAMREQVRAQRQKTQTQKEKK